jgi:hypothetical protein
MFAFNDGRMNTHIGDRSGGRVDDFNMGLYHRTVIQGNWEWKNYLGTGYQRYRMWRSPEFSLLHLPWNGISQLYEPRIEPATRYIQQPVQWIQYGVKHRNCSTVPLRRE